MVILTVLYAILFL